MLTLQIKKKWFDMIVSGKKKEEYREIKPYYTTRFKNIHLLSYNELPELWTETVIFKNGYSSSSPSITCEVRLTIGTGKPEWGAEPGKEYYILQIIEIKNVNMKGI